MASDKEYLEFVIESLRSSDVTYRPMMGEFVLYYQGKVVGGIYDNRLLLKPAKGALAILSEEGREPQWELPYEGAKEMIAADAEDALTLRLIEAVAKEVPPQKKRGEKKA